MQATDLSEVTKAAIASEATQLLVSNNGTVMGRAKLLFVVGDIKLTFHTDVQRALPRPEKYRYGA